MKKNILIITQKVNRQDSILGFFHRWIEEFARKCDKVTVICLEKGDYNLPENVRVFSLGKEFGVSRFTYIFRFYLYIFKLRKEYDCVFVHMNPVYVILGGFFWKIWCKKISLWYTHKHVDIKLRIAEKISNVIFSASKESFRLKSKKLHVMGHGIDTDVFIPHTKNISDTLRLVTVGRIAKIKNHHRIIEVVDLLKKSGMLVFLKIVGGPVTEKDSDYLNTLKEIVSEHYLNNEVVFVGEIKHDDIPEYISQQDIFINMSNTGSLDKAVLEAMACGNVVVTSNEAFKNMLLPFGLFVDGIDLVKISEIIKNLFENQNNMQQISLKLRNIVVQNHSLSNLVENIINLI